MIIEESKMTEQEFLNTMIDERVNMVLVNLNRNITDEENQKLFEAEQIIENLPEYEKKLIQNFVADIMNLLALEEPYLYKQGFKDGVRIMKELIKL